MVIADEKTKLVIKLLNQLKDYVKHLAKRRKTTMSRVIEDLIVKDYDENPDKTIDTPTISARSSLEQFFIWPEDESPEDESQAN
jgi:hypothetical protein